jgi:hypothetical protein
VNFVTNAVGPCGGSSSYTDVNPVTGGGCPQNADANIKMYNSCTFLYGGIEVGSGCLVANTVYSVCYTVPAGCGGINVCPSIQCTAGNCTTLMPVELLYFAAVNINGKVQLNWASASETNNNYFTIDRSQNAFDFEPLITVKGAGNSSSTLNYQTIDEKPLPDVSYYRLRQTDFNGAYVNFGIVSVENSSYLSVYPTVSSGLVVITGMEKSNSSEITVYSMMGEKVFSLSNNHEPAVDLGALPGGIYIILVTTGKESYTQKLVIQK